MPQTCSQPNVQAEGFQHWDNSLNILGLGTLFTLKICHRLWHTFYVCGFIVLIFTIWKLKLHKHAPPSAIRAVGEVLVGCPVCVWTQLRPHGLLGRMWGCPWVLNCPLIAVGYGSNQFPGFHWLISCIIGGGEAPKNYFQGHQLRFCRRWKICNPVSLHLSQSLRKFSEAGGW